MKCLDDDDKGICRSFFPPMFGEDAKNESGSDNEEVNTFVDKEATHKKYLELIKEYQNSREKSKNEYDFFNLVERSILGINDDENT